MFFFVGKPAPRPILREPSPAQASSVGFRRKKERKNSAEIVLLGETGKPSANLAAGGCLIKTGRESATFKALERMKKGGREAQSQREPKTREVSRQHEAIPGPRGRGPAA